MSYFMDIEKILNIIDKINRIIQHLNYIFLW